MAEYETVKSGSTRMLRERDRATTNSGERDELLSIVRGAIGNNNQKSRRNRFPAGGNESTVSEDTVRGYIKQRDVRTSQGLRGEKR